MRDADANETSGVGSFGGTLVGLSQLTIVRGLVSHFSSSCIGRSRVP